MRNRNHARVDPIPTFGQSFLPLQVTENTLILKPEPYSHSLPTLTFPPRLHLSLFKYISDIPSEKELSSFLPSVGPHSASARKSVPVSLSPSLSPRATTVTIVGLGFLLLGFRALNPNIRMTKRRMLTFSTSLCNYSSITCLGHNSNNIIIRVWQI